MNYKILSDLVSFNTIEDLENEKIIEYIKNYLEDMKFKVITISNNSNKKSLIATYGNHPNLCFIGHSDTVRCSNNWTTVPHKLTIKNDKMYGLGVCDMKGGIAAFLDALKEIDLNNIKNGIQIIITFDEEIGFEGINIVKTYRKEISNNILIGEPTDLIPVIACKGCMEYKVKFQGKAVHSSRLIFGDNAIVSCMKFMQELISFSECLKTMKSNLFTDISYTTMNIGLINGGTAINIVPDECTLSFDFRTVSKEHHKLIKDKIKEILSKYNVEYELYTNIYPCRIKNQDSINIIEKLTGNKSITASYVTEGNIILKDNTIILGPGPITAHEENEYITCSSYQKTIDIYKKIINYYCKE